MRADLGRGALPALQRAQGRGLQRARARLCEIHVVNDRRSDRDRIQVDEAREDDDIPGPRSNASYCRCMGAATHSPYESAPHRRAIDGLATLVEFRLAMFRDMGWHDEARLAELASRYEDYLCETLSRRAISPVGSLRRTGAPVAPSGCCGSAFLPRCVTCRPSGLCAGALRGSRTLGARASHPTCSRSPIVTRVTTVPMWSPSTTARRGGCLPAVRLCGSPEMRLFTDPAERWWAEGSRPHTRRRRRLRRSPARPIRPAGPDARP